MEPGDSALICEQYNTHIHNLLDNFKIMKITSTLRIAACFLRVICSRVTAWFGVSNATPTFTCARQGGTWVFMSKIREGGRGVHVEGEGGGNDSPHMRSGEREDMSVRLESRAESRGWDRITRG